MNLCAGTVVERYVVEPALGRGGMATVYAVKHTRLGTRHALEVLHTTDPDVRDRLLREGRFQARIDAAHIVPVTDVFDVDGAPCLLMPLVEGCSLAGLLAAHRPPEAETRVALAEAERIAADLGAGPDSDLGRRRAGARPLLPAAIERPTSQQLQVHDA